jgi:ferrous iron transport protein A
MALSMEDLHVGDCARVVAYVNSDEFAHRLMSLGLVPGTVICLKRIAPLGNPVEIHFRGFRLILRPLEAAGLTLERL